MLNLASFRFRGLNLSTRHPPGRPLIQQSGRGGELSTLYCRDKLDELGSDFDVGVNCQRNSRMADRGNECN